LALYLETNTNHIEIFFVYIYQALIYDDTIDR